MEGDIKEIVRDLWGIRWVNYTQLEASGTRGGIILMWDNRVWEGEISSIGSYSVPCNLQRLQVRIRTSLGILLEYMHQMT
uniref:Putative ovule protein n=1 Tax=Solanum chacoense TaxID=4108 RepID=A0A0V0HHN7_SOLCH